MRRRFLFYFLFLTTLASAQKYATRSGKTSFIGSEETFEQIKAVNNVSTSIVDSSSGDIAILLFISAFNFEISLMQEHFNENYMDSDKFPKATFKGQLIDFNMKHLSSEDKEFQLKGTLTIRGKDKLIATVAKLKKQHNKIVITSNLTVKPEEFDIKIPGIVRDKIAKSINLNLHYELVEKK